MFSQRRPKPTGSRSVIRPRCRVAGGNNFNLKSRQCCTVYKGTNLTLFLIYDRSWQTSKFYRRKTVCKLRILNVPTTTSLSPIWSRTDELKSSLPSNLQSGATLHRSHHHLPFQAAQSQVPSYKNEHIYVCMEKENRDIYIVTSMNFDLTSSGVCSCLILPPSNKNTRVLGSWELRVQNASMSLYSLAVFLMLKYVWLPS